MIIMVGGEKGGPGKSTVSSLLSLWFELKGERTLLVDTDYLQRSSANLMERRLRYSEYHREFQADPEWTPLIPDTICLSADRMFSGIKEALISTNYEHVIIDQPGRDSAESRIGLEICDLALFVLQPSQLDIETIKKLDIIVPSYTSDNKNFVGAYALFNRVKQEEDYKDAKAFVMSDVKNITPLMSYLADRKVYQKVADFGLAITESTINFKVPDHDKPGQLKDRKVMKDKKAVAEFDRLTAELLELVNRG